MASKTGAVAPIENDPNAPGEIVFTELNLEKWSIWEPNSTNQTARARIIERQRTLEDGSHVTARVEIGFTQHGNLSTRDQRIYYILCKMWDDAGRPQTPVIFSLQKIARLLGEEWGSKARRSIARSLLQLRNIWFNWENSYFDKSSGEHIELLDTFNILSELTLARRTTKLHATNEQCIFQFHREILKNLDANHTTPLFLNTVLSFKSEIAQMLYPRLDLLMADKNHYERRTKELFEELGLEAETYRHRSARKRVLAKALAELQGVPLTTGYIVSATIEPTKDNTDFKIVIQKGVRRKIAAAHAKAILPTTYEATAQPAEQATEAALVGYFHQQFHGAIPKGSLNPKEIAGAARLIQQHGLTKAKALIDFAHEEAPKTNYKPASLNGILQYEGRYEAEQAQRASEKQARATQRQHKQRAQEAQESRERALGDALVERVGAIKSGTPGAFTAFLRHVENRRAQFLATPVARRAGAVTREALGREYERPLKRLEIFVEFFRTEGEGEALLARSVQGQAISRWLGENGEDARALCAGAGAGADDDEVLTTLLW